jgi:hypothetical protein
VSAGHHDDKTLEDLPGPDRRPSVHDDIHVVLECDRPLAGSTRHCIDDIDCVVFRRGPTRAATRESLSGVRTLTLETPDRHMSSVHGGMRRFAGQWLFEDTGSRNGSYLQGRRISGAALIDGHALQLGHTLFLLRSRDLPNGPRDTVPDRSSDGDDGPLATLSHALETALQLALDAFRAGTAVVLAGEAGTGKEVLARGLHAQAGAGGSFATLACPSLGEAPGEAIDAAFARAAGGTLFLDRLEAIGRDGARALASALQSFEWTPNFRVIGSLRSNDPGAALSGVDEDLIAALSPYALPVPPLRDRIEDLGTLASRMLGRTTDPEALRIDPGMGQALALHDWPHNVRELEGCLRSGAASAADGHLRWSPPQAAHEAPEGNAPSERPPLESSSHRRAPEVQTEPTGEFAQDVRRALKCNLSLHLLQRNGLLESEMVLDAARGASAASITAPLLREIVLAAIESLRQSSARGAKQASALQLTFVEPAPSQQDVADRLGMAFGTYRRHITAGLVELTGILWFREQAARRRRIEAEGTSNEGMDERLRSG